MKLPKPIKIEAKPINFELVSVQPMCPPSGKLFFLESLPNAPVHKWIPTYKK